MMDPKQAAAALWDSMRSAGRLAPFRERKLLGVEVTDNGGVPALVVRVADPSAEVPEAATGYDGYQVVVYCRGERVAAVRAEPASDASGVPAVEHKGTHRAHAGRGGKRNR